MVFKSLASAPNKRLWRQVKNGKNGVGTQFPLILATIVFRPQIFPTVDIVLAIHSKRESVRTKSHGQYFIELSNKNAPIYSKADKTSEIYTTVPEEIIKLDSNYSIKGLNDDDMYWYVYHIEENVLYVGYVHVDDVK